MVLKGKAFHRWKYEIAYKYVNLEFVFISFLNRKTYFTSIHVMYQQRKEQWLLTFLEEMSPTSSIHAFIVGNIKFGFFSSNSKHVYTVFEHVHKLGKQSMTSRIIQMGWTKPLNPWNWLTKSLGFDRSQIKNHWNRMKN